MSSWRWWVCCALVLVACGGSSCSGRESADTGATTTTTAQTSTTATPAVPPGAVVTALRDVEAGQCFELPRDDAAADNRAVWVIDCAEPHTYEVYAIVDYEGDGAASDPYPGIDPVQNWSEQACYDRFEGFIGIEWTRSSFDIQAWWPSGDSWRMNDRSVICAVFAESGDLSTGSQRGAAT